MSKKKRNKLVKHIVLLNLCLISSIYMLMKKDKLFIDNEVLNSSNLVDINELRNNSQNSFENVNSSNAILIRLDDESMLLNKLGDERIYPASLTKIMTAIVAIEKIGDLNKEIYLSDDIFNELYEDGASMAGFLPNEKVKAIDLLYGVMLPSGAESCLGLAEYTAGSEENFVRMMNDKAKELGMLDTNYKNSTGLHHRKHYSTVEDIAKLLKYSLKNDVFREIYTAKEHTTEGTNMHPEGITLYSTMFKYMDSDRVKNGRIEGGKTGYTDEANLCLASLATINGAEYIFVTANAEGNPQTTQFNIEDAFNVYNRIN